MFEVPGGHGMIVMFRFKEYHSSSRKRFLRFPAHFESEFDAYDSSDEEGQHEPITGLRKANTSNLKPANKVVIKA